MSKAIIDEILRLTPTEGFNIVAASHGLPGQRPTLVAHLPTRDAAEKRLALLRRSLPDGNFEIYAPINPR